MCEQLAGRETACAETTPRIAWEGGLHTSAPDCSRRSPCRRSSRVAQLRAGGAEAADRGGARGTPFSLISRSCRLSDPASLGRGVPPVRNRPPFRRLDRDL